MRDIRLVEVRCPICRRKLLEMSGRASIKCPKCKSLVYIDVKGHIIKIVDVDKLNMQ